MVTCALNTRSLDEVKAGDHAVFQMINGGKGIASRLSSLGFTPGVDIKMTQNYGRGPLLVTVRGTRIALGRQEAQKIIVTRDTTR